MQNPSRCRNTVGNVPISGIVGASAPRTGFWKRRMASLDWTISVPDWRSSTGMPCRKLSGSRQRSVSIKLRLRPAYSGIRCDAIVQLTPCANIKQHLSHGNMRARKRPVFLEADALPLHRAPSIVLMCNCPHVQLRRSYVPRHKK